MFCEPKIAISYHHTVVAELVKQRDEATKECKGLVADLKDVTDNLVSMTETMKDQSDAIDSFIKTISTQKEAIDVLEARIAALEKPDPDMSIYDDELSTCELPESDEDVKTAEEEHQEQLDTLNRLVLLLILVGSVLGVGVGLLRLPKEFSYDLLD